MRYFLKTFLITLCLFVQLSNKAMAQAAGGGDPILDETLTNVYIVTGMMSFGAILGLSTLSFVEEPSENLKNIVTGGAIGIILGVGIVAFLQAGKSQQLYDQGMQAGASPSTNRPEFSPNHREDELTREVLASSLSSNLVFNLKRNSLLQKNSLFVPLSFRF